MALTALAVVGLLAVSGVLLSRSAEERQPGETATGDIAATGPTGDVARGLETARHSGSRARPSPPSGPTTRSWPAIPDNPKLWPTGAGWCAKPAPIRQRRAGGQGARVRQSGRSRRPLLPVGALPPGPILYEDKHDPAAAVPELRAFLDAGPPPAMVAPQELLRQAEAKAGAGSSPPAPKQ